MTIKVPSGLALKSLAVIYCSNEMRRFCDESVTGPTGLYKNVPVLYHPVFLFLLIPKSSSLQPL